MHELLFAHQVALEAADFQRYAAELGLDLDGFECDRTASQIATSCRPR
jgi:hypothetical protein